MILLFFDVNFNGIVKPNNPSFLNTRRMSIKRSRGRLINSITGLDATPAMLEKAKALPFSSLVCHQLESTPLPFKDGRFDVVTMLGVMEFIKRPRDLFIDIRRVLKNEGLLGFTIPLKLTSKKAKSLGIRTFDLSEILSNIGRSGFKIVRNDSFPGYLCNGVLVQYQGILCYRYDPISLPLSSILPVIPEDNKKVIPKQQSKENPEMSKKKKRKFTRCKKKKKFN